MSEEKFIDPGIVGVYGVCPECKNTLTIFQRESNIFSITPDGSPVTTECREDKIYGICTNCGNRIDFVRNAGKFIPYTKPVILASSNNLNKVDCAYYAKSNYSNPFEEVKENTNNE